MRTEILYNCYSCDAALDPIPSLIAFLTVQHIILVVCYVFAIINTKLTTQNHAIILAARVKMTLKRAQNTYKPQNINSIITLKGFDLRK